MSTPEQYFALDVPAHALVQAVALLCWVIEKLALRPAGTDALVDLAAAERLLQPLKVEVSPLVRQYHSEVA